MVCTISWRYAEEASRAWREGYTEESIRLEFGEDPVE